MKDRDVFPSNPYMIWGHDTESYLHFMTMLDQTFLEGLEDMKCFSRSVYPLFEDVQISNATGS